MKEIHSYKKVHPNHHLIIVRDDELQAIRKKSKEFHAHLPENNTNRVILSLSVSSEEAGMIRIVAARAGKKVSQWLRGAAIFRAYRDELTPAPSLSDDNLEEKAGDLLAFFIN